MMPIGTGINRDLSDFQNLKKKLLGGELWFEPARLGRFVTLLFNELVPLTGFTDADGYTKEMIMFPSPTEPGNFNAMMQSPYLNYGLGRGDPKNKSIDMLFDPLGELPGAGLHQQMRIMGDRSLQNTFKDSQIFDQLVHYLRGVGCRDGAKVDKQPLSPQPINFFPKGFMFVP